MAEIKTGGPAFPVHTEIRESEPHAGMTLRDHFAANALQGMLAHSTRYRPRPEAPASWHYAISQEAYEIADAMIAAREGGAK